ncbi:MULTISPECIES: HlyD family efflux transporter periplasmic adaptor subunit [unclassified Mesorhizobium]|uniref:efflux RND transporter periplasmic adaptor subunit n=1 Tax=unclassified Mesorhizobium TaxID=325217 RepID=UPI000FCB8B6F|nr:MULTISPECIES: HlyD family efflux transporter periplasmic adaptor subunit [unclassified Mesorhizobium]RUV54379.1 HlyD family efflux transporter periplasmic adaptor subunit [Mesorhizobium sp. M5C.F.Ca.IN.020.29.1.1]RWH81313.1 MAG: HlyD family efflux transporter periplasmic adaptor subunit [Mesorhizobium sp.]RWH85714.1 MAG: HlyD family efflux transporter periplasmic adaptor subunit [Mesorhizobium sp.]RWH90971.1 MAG: HlyD family efflux transporter periplasmic adaptor subunit [Mesorhizobium sp.]
MRSIWIKRGGLGLVAAAVIAGFAWALREEPAFVDMVEVTAAPMKVTIREEGITRVRDIYTVSAPIAGHLTRTVVNEGDVVRANDTVVASIHPLDPPLIDRRAEAELLATRDAARAGIGVAEIELQRAQSALKLAEDELARTIKLFGSGFVSESTLQRLTNEVDLRKTAVDAAKAVIGLRNAELANAEARLLQPDPADPTGESCCVNLLAPIDGTVLAVMARSEQAVVPGTKVAEIGNIRNLEVAVDLLSADAVRIAPATRAQISDWGGDRALRATVRRVDPAAFTKVSALGIEEQRVTAVLDMDDTDARLGHGYRVFVEMTVWECPKCVQVPIGALFRTGGKWSVFVADRGRVRQAEIEIGHMSEDAAEVLAGLEPGLSVVVHPADTLSDGDLVKRRN